MTPAASAWAVPGPGSEPARARLLRQLGQGELSLPALAVVSADLAAAMWWGPPPATHDWANESWPQLILGGTFTFTVSKLWAVLLLALPALLLAWFTLDRSRRLRDLALWSLPASVGLELIMALPPGLLMPALQVAVLSMAALIRRGRWRGAMRAGPLSDLALLWSLPAGPALGVATALVMDMRKGFYGRWQPDWLPWLASPNGAVQSWQAWLRHEPLWALLLLALPALQLIVLLAALSPHRLRDLAPRSLSVSASTSVLLGMVVAPVFVLPGLWVLSTLQMAAIPVATAIVGVRFRSWRLLRLGESAPVRLTRLAVFIAGEKRASALRDEWDSHQAGEAGPGASGWRQTRTACGFLRASARYRWQDAADLWWKPADRVLTSRRWSGAVVWLPTLYAAVLVIRHDGLYGVIVHFESLATLCGSLLVAIRLGRRWRGVKPPPHKPSRDKQQ